MQSISVSGHLWRTGGLYDHESTVCLTLAKGAQTVTATESVPGPRIANVGFSTAVALTSSGVAVLFPPFFCPYARLFQALPPIPQTPTRLS